MVDSQWTVLKHLASRNCGIHDTVISVMQLSIQLHLEECEISNVCTPKHFHIY
jgi:hypothetical protein